MGVSCGCFPAEHRAIPGGIRPPTPPVDRTLRRQPRVGRYERQRTERQQRSRYGEGQWSSTLRGHAPPPIPTTQRNIFMNSIIYIVGLVVVVLVVMSFFGLR